VRPGKMTLAALAATLSEWIRRGPEDLPIYRLASTPPEQLRRRAEAIAASIETAELALDVRESRALFGGGTTPGRSIPSVAIRVASRGLTAAELHRKLRIGEPPVIGRIEEEVLWLDLAGVFPDQDEKIVEALKTIGSREAETVRR
jgi:L-seryl-tRNA(Ser) seleniumtransferase